MKEKLSDNVLTNARLWLKRLKKNEQEIGKDVLKEKYSTGYKKMITYTNKAIRIACEEFVFHMTHGMQVEKEKYLNNHLLDAAVKTARGTYCLDDAFDMVFPSFVQVIHEVYQPYWLNHVKKKNGVYHNDLIDMDWIEADDRNGCWKNDKAAMLGLPPTKERCDVFCKEMLEGAT